MGTFAGIWKAADAIVPEAERDNFVRDEAELFWRAGMLELRYKRIDGTEIIMLQRPGSRQKWIDVVYNYFSDDVWEDAGIRREPLGVFSNKVGGAFLTAVVAAYMLEGNYINGPTATQVDGMPTIDFAVAEWIQKLFPRRRISLPDNIWTYLDASRGSAAAPRTWTTVEESLQYWAEYAARDIAAVAREWARKRPSVTSFLSAGEVLCVLDGTDVWLRDYCVTDEPDTSDKEQRMCWLVSKMCKACAAAARAYKEQSQESADVQFQTLKQMWMNDARTLALDPDALLNQSAEPDVTFARQAASLGAPAFALAVLCETYIRPFWEEWAHIPVEIRWAQTRFAASRQVAPTVTTQDLFGLLDDEMIPWWTPDCDLVFSDDMRRRFRMFADRFADAMQHPRRLENPALYYARLLSEADDRYYHIYPFIEFVEESLNTPDAPHIRAMWTVLGELIYDPALTDAAGVIFRNPYIRRQEPLGPLVLKEHWDMMPAREKHNEGRATIKQYLALMGNRALRKDVLGV